MSPGEDVWCISLLEATAFTYLLIVRDQRVEWEQQQKGESTSYSGASLRALRG